MNLVWWLRRTVVTVAVVVYITHNCGGSLSTRCSVRFGYWRAGFIRLSEGFAVLWSSWSPQIQIAFRVIISVLLLDIMFDALAETGYLAGLLRVIRYAAVAFTALRLWTFISVQARLLRTEPTAKVSTV